MKEMNSMGIIVDVSHISDEAFLDVIELSKVPVIASHSCVKKLCNHPRNLNDKLLKKLAEKGGVIQMCFVSEYLKQPEPNPKRDSALQAIRSKYQNFSMLSNEEKQKARKERNRHG